MRLFDRIGRRIQLTAEGQDLPAASPRAVDGRRLARRAGEGPQGREDRRAPRRRHAAGNGDSARRVPSTLSPGAPRCRRPPRRGRRRPARHPSRARRRPPGAHRVNRRAVPLALAGPALRPGRPADVIPAGSSSDVGDRRSRGLAAPSHAPQFRLARMVDALPGRARAAARCPESGHRPRSSRSLRSRHGIAIVPSNVRIPRDGVRAVPSFRWGADRPMAGPPGTRGDSWRRSGDSSRRSRTRSAKRSRAREARAAVTTIRRAPGWSRPARAGAGAPGTRRVLASPGRPGLRRRRDARRRRPAPAAGCRTVRRA